MIWSFFEVMPIPPCNGLRCPGNRFQRYLASERHMFALVFMLDHPLDIGLWTLDSVDIEVWTLDFDIGL